ncbi:hypothetical protein M7I_2393 [Glarea lozoyensis 74030]|nr:hypothetical protein M7I_2393 [Glarea lozoyensis 74030]
MLAFILLRNKIARIFKPKTYLVPEKERTEPPPRTPWGWLVAIFQFRDREVIKKCGLDAYFFLRYLQTLLFIFVPIGVVVLPILLPLNYNGGRGGSYALEFGNSSRSNEANVTGLDQLAWGNVRPTHTNRYWAHLILALFVICWVCGVFFNELRVFIKIRQDYLTSAEHRLRASATTVLVSSIPKKWLSEEALRGLYDVFPGGIRNVWINRDFSALLEKIHRRDEMCKVLEGAQTELIRKAKKAQKKMMEKEEKANANKAKTKSATKEDREEKLRREDEEGQRLARSGGGVSAGDPHQVPHTMDDVLDEVEDHERTDEHVHAGPHHRKGLFKLPIVGGGLAAVGQGIGAVGQNVGKGFGAVGDTVIGGTRNIGRDLDNTVETTNGFIEIDARSLPDTDAYDHYGRFREQNTGRPYGADDDNEKKRASNDSSQSERNLNTVNSGMKLPGNVTRRHNYELEADGARDDPNQPHWWELWKAPGGGFASPIPTGFEDGDEFPLNQVDGKPSTGSKPSVSDEKEKVGIWGKFKGLFPSGDKVEEIEYPPSHNEDYDEDATPAEWKKYLKEKDRPKYTIAKFSWTPSWLPGIPGINEKVDTINYCRVELARLNLEIEMDQKSPERFPLMTSAFIQFNHQAAAHMACQSVSHHVPKNMAPRTVEIAPKDVIWENMAIKWWQAWTRTGLVTAIVTGMVILWAFPVAWTATLSQLSNLADEYSWLAWLNKIPDNILQGIAGVLPALTLAILLALVPLILNFLALFQGAQTGSEKQGSVQKYYFAFLFVQVFLVVSISGGITSFLAASTENITSVPSTLAVQLPKAANYFFSYMILQALSTASGTLLQIGTLILWFIFPKLFDNTARQKWTRNTTLPTITWGTFFPVYTNFACIAIIYSVVAPLIIVFAIITFSLLYVAHRYNMVYVTRFELDTGGLLYPRAINQTFTGLYMMEVCMVGLFFLVRDEDGNVTCTPQAIIMIVVIFLTILYQYLLNDSFGPLFRHLPITFEDEAEIRDRVFEKAQARRLGYVDDDEDIESGPKDTDDIEMSRLNGTSKSRFNPLTVAQGAGSWAKKSGRKLAAATFDNEKDHETRRRRRHRDTEAQKKIADALYGDLHDEIEDLDADERNVLIRRAFMHAALRARRPTVWIPRDDLGVSDDEIRRTRELAGKNVWISNVGASLDSKCRVVYGRNPPDWSEMDIINL